MGYSRVTVKETLVFYNLDRRSMENVPSASSLFLRRKKEPVSLKADSGLIDVSSGEAAKEKQIS